MIDMMQQPTALWVLGMLDIPVFISFLVAGIRFYKDVETRFAAHQKHAEMMMLQCEKNIMDMRLQISNEYARVAVVQEIERRVVSHLLRIESKLDVTALKAEAAHHKMRDTPKSEDL